MSRALRVNTATSSKSITCGEGQQNGAGKSPPLRLLLLGRCAFCFLSPARPACRAARGRAALLLSRSPATLPIRPKWLPKNKQGRTGEGGVLDVWYNADSPIN